MTKVGVVGVGDMGSGLAKNLIAAGFEVAGFDLDPERMETFVGMGGLACASASEVGQGAKAVFVMVMNGEQARSVILDGLKTTMDAGSAVILTATVHSTQARDIAAGLERNSGIVATAIHGVSAIPAACRAEPGIKNYLDLPLVAGRAAPHLARSRT